MPNFLVYPEINDEHGFEPEVNRAIINSPEAQEAIDEAVEEANGGLTGTLFVDTFALPGDFSDDLAWQRAVNAAKMTGAKRIQGNKTVYYFANPVKLGGTKGLTVSGSSQDRTVIKVKTNITVPFAFVIGQGEADVDDLTISDLGADGNMLSEPAGMSRDRSYSTTRLETLLRINSARVPGQEFTHPSVHNVTVTNVKMYGLKELPLFISGVSGRVTIHNVLATRCLDIGVTHSDNYHFTNNSVILSADNGVSLSRGNNVVVCTGNSFINSWYWGIHAAGWAGEAGPDTVTISGNVILTAGYGGIYLGLAPKNVTVVGNTVRDALRGATNNSPDYGVGIYVAGYGPADSFGAPTIYAENINITGNTLIDCKRGGIAIWSSKNVLVNSNLIIRPGTEKLPDGSTTSANDGWQNFGIATPGSSAPGNTYQNHVFNVKTIGNLIVDDRVPAFMKHGTYKSGIPTAQWTDTNNTVVGAAITYSEFLPEAIFAANLRVGYSTGTTANLFLDGPASIVRQMVIRSGTSKRWVLRATNGADTSTAAGSDLQLVAVENDGVTENPVFTVTRGAGQLTFNSAPRLPQYATASRPTASGRGAGSMIWDSTLKKPVWSNGTAWTDANGTVV